MKIEALKDFAHLVQSGECRDYQGTLKVGVDLGTANIVLAVVDGDNRPLAGMMKRSRVVRDGVLVDYVGAVRVVKELKAALEDRLKTELVYASAAIPPGVAFESVRAIGNVVESAGMVLTNVVDEPTAAAMVLGIDRGAVVDVGGGTTGISIMEGGRAVSTVDEPTGGTHMSLVVSGAYHVSYEEGEAIKEDRTREDEVFTLVQPVVEKMATIVKRAIEGRNVEAVYVVGGACIFDRFEGTMERITGVKTYKPQYPLLVTPLGIAFACEPGRVFEKR